MIDLERKPRNSSFLLRRRRPLKLSLSKCNTLLSVCWTNSLRYDNALVVRPKPSPSFCRSKLSNRNAFAVASISVVGTSHMMKQIGSFTGSASAVAPTTSSTSPNRITSMTNCSPLQPPRTAGVLLRNCFIQLKLCTTCRTV